MDIVPGIERDHIVVVTIEVSAALGDIAGVALLTELRPPAGIHLEADGSVHLEALDGVHADAIEEVSLEVHARRGHQNEGLEPQLGQRQIRHHEAD